MTKSALSVGAAAVFAAAAYAVGHLASSTARGGDGAVVQTATEHLHDHAAAARTPEDAAGRRVLYYVDPMHPSYRSDRPGRAPDCGMDLQPVYADAAAQDEAAAATAADAITLSPERERAATLATETVRLVDVASRYHTAGRVIADETRTYIVSAGVDGWIRAIFSDASGADVRRGQPLASFYSRELSATQQAYVYALESQERLAQLPAPPPEQLALATRQLALARDNLRFTGMGDGQIAELGRRRQELFDIQLTAPADGRVLERRVSLGQRFTKGDILYRVADLTRVWVDAIVPPDQALAGAFSSARVTAEGQPPITAYIAAAPPRFDTASERGDAGRNGRVRVEVENIGGQLSPGLLVDVDLVGPATPQLTIAASALVDVGRSPHVFVARGRGQYELRRVDVGRQSGDRVEVRAGLKEGEQVVTAGAFLLDSESRLQGPAVPPTAHE